MRRVALLSLLFLAGCRGTVPELFQEPEAGIASVLIGCRMTLPTGETPNGSMAVNFEGVDGAETYRLPLKPQRSLLYQIEPGEYRLSPTRNLLGFVQSRLRVSMEGRAYKVQFPREMLRLQTYHVRPRKIVAVGIVDVTMLPRKPGQPATVKVRLDDSVDARRQLIQTQIQAMMDPNAPPDMRSAALGWLRQLEGTLSEVTAEAQRSPAFRPVP